MNKYIKMLFKILGSLLILGIVNFWTLQSPSIPTNLTFSKNRIKRVATESNINEKIWNKIKEYLPEFTKVKKRKLHYSYSWNIERGKDVKKELSIDLDILQTESSTASYKELPEAIKKVINKIKLFIAGDQKIIWGWWSKKNINNGLKGNKIADSFQDNQPQWIQVVKDKIQLNDDDIDVVLERLLKNSMNDALNNLKTKFQGKLKVLVDAGIHQFTINNIFYDDFNLLLKDDNLQLAGSQLPDDAKNQLLKLVNWSFNEETLDEAVLQEIDRKEKFIEIILKFNKWRKIDKITIKGENYLVKKIKSDDAYTGKNDDVLKQINELMKIKYIDEQMLIKACFFEVLQFNWGGKLNESELKEEFKKHLTNSYSFTTDSKLPEEFTDIIFEKEKNAETNQKLSWLENKKIIETLKTFVVAGITKVKIKGQTYSLNVSDRKTNSNDLYPPLYLNSEWKDLETDLLESYLEYIKPSLEKFKTDDNKISVLVINKKPYSILHLLKQLKEEYSKLEDGVKKQVQNELKILSGLPETKKKLETYKTNLETKKKDFWKNIQKSFKNLKLINIKIVKISTQNYQIGELLKMENIDKEYADLSDETKTEFTKLFNNGITEKKLTEFYENKLNLFLQDIKPTLQILKTLNATEITIDKQTYPISKLTVHLNKIGSEIVGEAKNELLTLYNYNSNIKIIKEKLNDFLASKRETFRKSIKEIISNLMEIRVIDIQIGKENYLWYNLTHIFSPAKITDINKKYVDMVPKAQAEFKLLYENGITKEKLSELYKSKLDSLLDVISSNLQAFAEIKITQFLIDDQLYEIDDLTNHLDKKGSELVDEAKNELIDLYNHKKILNKILNITQLKFGDQGIQSATSGEELTDLLAKVDLANIKLVDGNPIGGGMASVQSIDFVSVSNAKGFFQIKYSVATIINNAKVRSKLETALKMIRDDFQKKISDILLKINKIKINKIKIETKYYSLEKLKKWIESISKFNDLFLLNKNNENSRIEFKGYDNMPPNVQKEFTKLLADEINEEKLTTFYKELLDTFLDIIRPTLQEIATGGNISVTINDKSYSIENLILPANLDKKGSAQVGVAKTELLALYNYDKSEFKTNIQVSLNNLAAINIKTIKIDTQNYQIGELLQKENIDKVYADMSFGAQKQFTKLWIQGVNKEKLSKALENIKLKSFHLTIKDILDDLVAIGLTELRVKDKIYTLTELTNSENQNKDVYQMNSQAREELKVLFNSDLKEKEKEKVSTVLKSIKLDIEKSLKAILKEKPRLINAGIMFLSFTNGEKVNTIIDINYYINLSKKENVKKPKYQLFKLRNKNIKKIVDQNIDQDFLEKWQIWKKKSKILTNLKINKLEFIDENTKEKTNIDLVLFRGKENKEKPSEINELSTLKELNKTRKISVEKFENLINVTIQRQNDKILLKKQLTQKNNQKTLTIGLAVGGSALVLGMFGFGIGWFFKFRSKS